MAQGSGLKDVADCPVEVSATVTAEEWDTYVAAHPEASGYHQWCWRGLFERVFGHETIYLAARRTGVARVFRSLAEAQEGEGGRPAGGEAEVSSANIVGVLPLVSFKSRLFGKFLVSLPFVNYGGVLADDDEAARTLVDAARSEAQRRGASSVELRHTRRMFPDLPVKQHKVAMTLALPGDAETAWKGFDNKVRNQIRKAEKSNLEAVTGGTELAGEFYSVFARNMRDLGTPVYSRCLFEEVLGSIPDSRAYSMRLNGLPVAAGITIGYRGSVENPWASSLREHRSLNPNMLLYWTMLRDAIARGFRVFDFGRSTPNEGTYQFKSQWGAQGSPFFWEYIVKADVALPDHSPKNARFEAAVAIWQRLPLAVTALLGPRIVRNIP
jgi:serine/alanine adding enzyme